MKLTDEMIVNIGAGVCVVIVAAVLGIGILLGQCLDVNARLAHEVKLMRQQQVSDDGRIKELELDRAHRQNKVIVEAAK